MYDYLSMFKRYRKLLIHRLHDTGTQQLIAWINSQIFSGAEVSVPSSLADNVSETVNARVRQVEEYFGAALELDSPGPTSPPLARDVTLVPPILSASLPATVMTTLPSNVALDVAVDAAVDPLPAVLPPHETRPSVTGAKTKRGGRNPRRK
jgi:hypothetical protein